MLWCSSTRRPRCSRSAGAERRGQRVVQDHDVVGSARPPLGEAAPVALEVRRRARARRRPPRGPSAGTRRASAARSRRSRRRGAARAPTGRSSRAASGRRSSRGGAPSSTGAAARASSAPKSVRADPATRARAGSRGDPRAAGRRRERRVEQLGHQLGLLVLEQQPAAAQRLAHRAGVVGDHGHAEEPSPPGAARRSPRARRGRGTGRPAGSRRSSSSSSTCPVKTTSSHAAARATSSRRRSK